MHKLPSPQPSHCPWGGWEMPSMQFCEANLCSWITQPANTWSNLVYFVVAIYIWNHSSGKNKPRSRLIAPIVFLIGLGSFLFHASATFFGQFFDLGFMFLFSSLIVSMNFKRLEWIKPKHELPLFYVLSFLGMGILYLNHHSGIPYFTAEILIFIITEYKLSQSHAAASNYKELKIAVGFLILSQLSWQLDYRGIVCNENNHWLQGHALWHVLNSIAFVWFYKFTLRIS